MGYEHIDYHKDSKDPEKVRVVLKAKDIAVEFKLDKDFNFDFEGLAADIPSIVDHLRLAILFYLRAILCEEKLQNERGGSLDYVTDADGNVQTRVAHLMFLAEGKNFTLMQQNIVLRMKGLILQLFP